MCKELTNLFFLVQAGTQFWDEKLENELAEGRLSGTAFDRYIAIACMIYLSDNRGLDCAMENWRYGSS